MKFASYIGDYLIEKIRDSAGQKGTGKWAAIEAINGGVPATVILESVCARFTSALKDDRVKASNFLPGPERRFFTSKEKVTFIADIQQVC